MSQTSLYFWFFLLTKILLGNKKKTNKILTKSKYVYKNHSINFTGVYMYNKHMYIQLFLFIMPKNSIPNQYNVEKI